MPGRFSIAKQGLAIVALLLAVELFFVGSIAVFLQDTRAKLARERHVVAVMSGSSNVANLTQRFGTALAQAGAPKRLRDMIGDNSDVEKYKIQLQSEFRRLKKLAAQDPEALSMVEEQEKVVQGAIKHFGLDWAKNEKNDSEREGLAASMLATGHDISGQYERFLRRYKSVEESSPRQVADSIAQLKLVMILGVVLNLLVGLLLSYFFVRRVTSRIDKLADNMTRYQRGEELVAAPVGAGDEISQIEGLFENMVEVVAQARRNEETLIQGAYDVICTIDANGVFTEVNKACEKQWGYERTELTGRNFDLVVSPSDVSTVKKNLERLKNKSGFINFDTGIERIDGGKVETSWSCYWSSESKSAFCFIRDVSDLNSMEAMLRAREEQVRTLIANIPVGILVVDEHGVVKSANHKIEALINRSGSDVLERSIEEMLEPVSSAKPVFQDAFGETNHSVSALIARGAEGVQRFVLKRKDGDQIVAEVSVTPLSATQSADSLVVIEDVSERVRLENIKRDFVALLRENLRSPLEAVSAMIGAVSGGAQESDVPRINRIVANADRLLRLIDELLTIETLSPGRLVGELKPVAIADILDQSVQSLTDYATKQGVLIRLESVNSEVMADRDRLVQVVVNLLSNAVKFSPVGAEVLIASEALENDIEVSITDSGKGIPDNLQEAIFKPYVQASAVDGPKGTGLGLPICKAIVESHKGSIGVMSTAKCGSRFWFRIPRVSN